jgi:GTPase SAR1 family protein
VFGGIIFEGAQGVIFVVDSSDRSVFQKATEEFHQLAQAPQLKGCPLLIFADKQVLELQVLDSERYHVEVGLPGGYCKTEIKSFSSLGSQFMNQKERERDKEVFLND